MHIVKERIGLPIWEDDAIKGTKHFFPGQEVTAANFDEARQDQDQRAEIIEHNCWTKDQYEIRQRIDVVDDQLTRLQAAAANLHDIDFENMTFTVKPGFEAQHEQVQADVAKLRSEKADLEAKLNA